MIGPAGGVRRAGAGLRRARSGFTFVEMLVVVTLSALLIAAVQQALVGQLRFHEVQRAASARNASVRTGLAVLTASLREASVPDGDVEVLSPRSVRVRVPYGFALVCGVDNNGNRVGIVSAQGALGAGDSVLVRRAGGRSAELLNQIDPPHNSVPCTGAATGAVLRFDRRTPDVIPDTGVRSFRSHLLESVVQGGSQWLYRDDGVQRDLLAGPLDLADGFNVWYEALDGTVVADPTLAERVAVRLVARAPDVRGRIPLVRDTLRLTFGGAR